jgi:hypothetical protein
MQKEAFPLVFLIEDHTQPSALLYAPNVVFLMGSKLLLGVREVGI